jgi:hypothetical protein
MKAPRFRLIYVNRDPHEPNWFLGRAAARPSNTCYANSHPSIELRFDTGGHLERDLLAHGAVPSDVIR